MMLEYTHLPRELMKVTLVPILKCKTISPSDSQSYRPIALPTSASKLLESILQQRMKDFLLTSHAQFGFKANHGTEMAIFAFKETVNSYLKKGSPVFTCFLDASKAFDKLNHNKLFKILQNRGMPTYIINLLSYWYSNQEYAIKWGNSFSLPFRVSNGIRQGGIISPYLYNVYTDELTTLLDKKKIGCHVDGMSLNHVVYADDMVVLAPSAKALQEILDTCHEFAQSRDITYNKTKTVCMKFLPRNIRSAHINQFRMGSTPLNFTEEIKYLGHIICSSLRDDADVLRQ